MGTPVSVAGLPSLCCGPIFPKGGLATEVIQPEPHVWIVGPSTSGQREQMLTKLTHKQLVDKEVRDRAPGALLAVGCPLGSQVEGQRREAWSGRRGQGGVAREARTNQDQSGDAQGCPG